MSKSKTSERVGKMKVIRAYAGFLNWKLDKGWIWGEHNTPNLYSIFATKKEAREHYEDVRPVEIKILHQKEPNF